MSEQHIPVITLDGPSGTGKGTISLMLAKYLKWHYLDSGAIYRVLAYAADKKKIDLNSITELVQLAHTLDLHFEINNSDTPQVFLSAQDITASIRTEECGSKASKLAAIPDIRKALLQRQRQFAKPPGLVTDGRDMGTVVFPEADLKLYLFATPEERAKRRYLQLKEKENHGSLAQVVEDLRQRDERDMERAHSPLRPAENAVKIDTTELTIVHVFDNVLQLVKTRLLKSDSV